jgi:DNA-binding transcriptional LysR family regulator
MKTGRKKADMNIHQVKIFNAVAQTLSVTQAAKKIHLSQPSVSIQIKDLEDALHVRLFDRINRKMSLTDAGKVFYEYSERLLNLIDEIDAVMNEFSSGDVGRLVFGASSTVGIYVLPRFLGEFKELYPKAEIALHIQNRQEAVELCLAGELDFAFMQTPPKNTDLLSEFFMKDELVIVCSSAHRWAKRDHLTLDQLISEPENIIMREKGSGTRYLIENVLKRYRIKSKIIMEMSSSEGIKRAVEANLGIAVLSRNIVANETRNNSLVELSIKDLDTSRDFYIVRNKKRTNSQLMEIFHDFIMEKSRDLQSISQYEKRPSRI